MQRETTVNRLSRVSAGGTDSVYVQAPPNVQVFVPPGEYVRSFAMIG
ncbi:hypothetical protein BH23GEM10_BH23GEM10_13480 [soil metagenome]